MDNATDAMLTDLLGSAPVLVWTSGPDRLCTYFNKAWLDFTGRTMAQERGNGWTEGVHPADYERRLAMYTGHFDRRQPFRMEYRLRRHDGAWRWVLDAGVPRHGAGGEFLGFVGSCLDITEMKEAEQQRVRDIEDKAAMLQELHHRMRNNAQVFASLLTIQAGRAADGQVRDALRTAASRAAAISIAQEQMHETAASGSFDLGACVNMLVQTLDVAGGDRIAIAVDAPEPVLVPLIAAVPLALIVNELLHNALKHAFPAGRTGRVGVVLWREADGSLSVSVADDGAGVPPGMDLLAQRSSGMTIVKSLARRSAPR